MVCVCVLHMCALCDSVVRKKGGGLRCKIHCRPVRYVECVCVWCYSDEEGGGRLDRLNWSEGASYLSRCVHSDFFPSSLPSPALRSSSIRIYFTNVCIAVIFVLAKLLAACSPELVGPN